MRPVLRLVALTLFACLIGSERADAGIWDWLEELNGPGPSTTRGNFMMNFSCRRIDDVVRKNETTVESKPTAPEDAARLTSSTPLFMTTRNTQLAQPEKLTPTTTRKIKTFTTTTTEIARDKTTITTTTVVTDRLINSLPKFTIPKDASAAAKCWFFDVRALHAHGDARFYPVDILFPEIGTSIWLYDIVEIGGGAGGIFFTSRNKETGERLNGFRPTVTFPRIVFRPLLAIPQVENSRWGFFQLYFKESIIVGNLDENDFATMPGHTFSRHSQRVESMGFIIDLTALFNRTI